MERLFLRSPRNSSGSCQAAGCQAQTREGKPYCSEHVTAHPYVQRLLETLEERESEQEDVRSNGCGAVDTAGPTAGEILRHLSHNGPKTVQRIARDLQLELAVVRSYVRSLEGEGRVHLSQTSRGSFVVRFGAETRSGRIARAG